MDATSLPELQRRLHLLEEEMRRLRGQKINPFNLGLLGFGAIGGFFVAVLALTAGTPAAAQPGKETTRPTSTFEAPFEIQDKSKKTIVRVESDPVPALWLVGSKGSVKLVIDEGGGAVSVRSTKSTSPSALYCSDSGDGSLVLCNGDGKRSVDLGRSGLMTSKDGRVVAHLGVSPKGNSGYLAIANSNGDALVEAGMLENRGIVRAYPYHPRVGEILRGSNFIVGAKQ